MTALVGASSAALVGTLLAGLLGGPALPAAYDDRADVPEPTAAQIARSIDRYTIRGSVEHLVQESKDDGEQSIVLGTDVLFAYASSALDARARTAVEKLLAQIPQDAKVAVGGHTDSRGGDSVNVPLSKARAQAVADLLREARPDLHLTVHGYASSRPVAEEYPNGKDEPDYDAMAKNRRVELRVG